MKNNKSILPIDELGWIIGKLSLPQLKAAEGLEPKQAKWPILALILQTPGPHSFPIQKENLIQQKTAVQKY